MWKKVSHRFKRYASIEIESEPGAYSGLSPSAVEVWLRK
jgi:hypothetical protein